MILRFLGIAVALGGAASGAAAPVPEPPPPNIVILYADDMGYGDLAVQNPGSRIPTPNLDRLAAEGTRFTDAHSSSGICTPSRYALLTGSYHWRKFHDIVQSFDPPVLAAAEVTLAELLQKNGYRTACIGKWHLGWDWDALRRPDAPARDPKTGESPEAFDWFLPVPGGPLAHGFDDYFGDDVPNFPPYAWIEDDRVLTPPTLPLALNGKPAEGGWEARPGPMAEGWDFQAVPGRLIEHTVEWIGRQRGAPGPFFLYVPFNTPHAPIVPDDRAAGLSKAGGYGDFVAQTDDHVGRILRALDGIGVARQTLVVFTSDNGPESYAYERVRARGHRSAGQWRGLKRDLYEGGHRVPFVVRWPGVVPAGVVSEALVSQIDLFATLAAAAGAPLPPRSAPDSYDLMPVWRDGAPSPRRTLVHNTVRDVYALRHEQWVLIAAPSGTHTPVPEWYAKAENLPGPHGRPGELFDLSRDPGQRQNVYADHPEVVAELSEILNALRAGGQVR